MGDRTKLQMRVDGRNTVNRIGNEIFPALVEAFRPYLGENIRKQSGGLFAKIEKQIKEVEAQFPTHPSLHMICMNGLEYSLSYMVKCCETFCKDGKDYGEAIYSDTTVYIANLSNGVITSLYDPPEFKTDYDADTIIEARKTFKAAEEALSEARSALHPFGEND